MSLFSHLCNIYCPVIAMCCLLTRVFFLKNNIVLKLIYLSILSDAIIVIAEKIFHRVFRINSNKTMKCFVIILLFVVSVRWHLVVGRHIVLLRFRQRAVRGRQSCCVVPEDNELSAVVARACGNQPEFARPVAANDWQRPGLANQFGRNSSASVGHLRRPATVD